MSVMIYDHDGLKKKSRARQNQSKDGIIPIVIRRQLIYTNSKRSSLSLSQMPIFFLIHKPRSNYFVT